MGVTNPSLLGRGGSMGSERGPLSSPGTSSYSLPIVTIGLSFTDQQFTIRSYM